MNGDKNEQQQSEIKVERVVYQWQVDEAAYAKEPDRVTVCLRCGAEVSYERPDEEEARDWIWAPQSAGVTMVFGHGSLKTLRQESGRYLRAHLERLGLRVKAEPRVGVYLPAHGPPRPGGASTTGLQVIGFGEDPPDGPDA